MDQINVLFPNPLTPLPHVSKIGFIAFVDYSDSEVDHSKFTQDWEYFSLISAIGNFLCIRYKNLTIFRPREKWRGNVVTHVRKRGKGMKD